MSPFQVWVVFKFSTEHWWVLEPMIFMLKPTLKILKYWQHNIFLISKSWSYWESIVCAECLIGNDSDLIPVASSDFQSSPQMTRFAHVFFPQVFFEGASLVLPFNLLFPNLLFTKEIPSPPGSATGPTKQQVLQILASLWSCGSHCLCRVCLGWKLLMKVGILIGRLMGQGYYSLKAQQVRKVDPSWWQLNDFFGKVSPPNQNWWRFF